MTTPTPNQTPNQAPNQAPIVLLGAGGHALAVRLAAALAGRPVLGAYDDDPSAPLLTGAYAITHLGPLDAFRSDPAPDWILAMGDLPARRIWIGDLGTDPANAVVHPGAVVAPCAELGAGAFVGPGAVVHARARIGAHAIVNSGAIVEHECVVGENTHIAPGAVLCGRVRVGAGALVGAGSTTIPGVSIGAGAVLGAGAVATRDIPPGATAVGSPARVLARAER